MALLRKYRLLERWRRIKDGGAGAGDDTPPTAADLRALAREFPGALRELDVLGAAELSRRITRLEERAGDTRSAGAGAATAPPTTHDDRWMPWICGYHRLMRQALDLRRVAGRGRRLSAEDLAQLTGGAGELRTDQSFARAVLRPPAGRLNIVVLNRLAAHFGAPASEISRTLFPPRRPPSYEL